MATVTIKNIPDSVYQDLKRMAARHHRSMNQQVIVLLKSSSRSVQMDPEAFLTHVRRVRVKPRKGPLTDRVLNGLKRQGRL
ncbi:MAG: hypothetical protein GDA67_00150 [Nitrospira sp. CR1.3]|nr:hypothetical protein [Nitrospira sp. CR1.3]